MPCTVPTTASPGRLVLVYNDNLTGYEHTTGWHLISSADITNIAALKAEAIRLAVLLFPCLGSTLTITAWRVLLPSGAQYYQEAFASPYVGTHGLGSGMQRWKSTTVRIEGTAHPIAPGYCYGRTSCALYNQGALDFQVGAHAFDANTDGTYRAFINSGLNASTYLPADIYGQQADMLLLMPIQWNAHAQKVEGS